MKYLVVIPARGGSKGIPHKNIRIVSGKPLLQHTIDCILRVPFDGDIALSTDDDAIASIAKRSGKAVVIHRPDEISQDTSKTEEALLHAVRHMKMQGKEYGAVVTLQATSPLRKSETVMSMMRRFEENIELHDALFSVTEDKSDFWQRDSEGHFSRLFPDAPRRRQARKPLYVENSSVYITKVSSLFETCSVLGHNADAFVINKEEAIDINDFCDLAVAEALMKGGETWKRQ